MHDNELTALGEAGMDALARGAANEARRCFSKIVEAGRADGTVWVALALARQALGDADGVVQALDAALELEPQNVRALLMKGDVMAAAGDRRLSTAIWMMTFRSDAAWVSTGVAAKPRRRSAPECSPT